MANTTDVPKEDRMELPHAGLPAFDMDLLAREIERDGNKASNAHVFGQVDTVRGPPKLRQMHDEDEEVLARKRRRIAGVPNTEMSVSHTFSVENYSPIVVVVCT